MSTTETKTIAIRRDRVRPGMIIHSSHGYRLLITEVLDNASLRTDDRHVEFRGHLHANTDCAIRNERYPAGSLIEVELPLPFEFELPMHPAMTLFAERYTAYCEEYEGSTHVATHATFHAQDDVIRNFGFGFDMNQQHAVLTAPSLAQEGRYSDALRLIAKAWEAVC